MPVLPPPQPALLGLPTEQDVRRLIAEAMAKARRGPAYCSMANSEVYHGVASAHPCLPPELHQTRCAWAFGLVPGVNRFDEPPQLWRKGKWVTPCKKCWDPAVAPEAGGAG